MVSFVTSVELTVQGSFVPETSNIKIVIQIASQLSQANSLQFMKKENAKSPQISIFSFCAVNAMTSHKLLNRQGIESTTVP